MGLALYPARAPNIPTFCYKEFPRWLDDLFRCVTSRPSCYCLELIIVQIHTYSVGGMIKVILSLALVNLDKMACLAKAWFTFFTFP